MTTAQLIPARRRHHGSDLLAVMTPARFPQIVREALGSVPEDIVLDMVRGGTVAENVAALAQEHPDVLDPKRWQGLLHLLPQRARVPGMMPLRALEIIENPGIDG
jgi:hypothetical protein